MDHIPHLLSLQKINLPCAMCEKPSVRACGGICVGQPVKRIVILSRLRTIAMRHADRVRDRLSRLAYSCREQLYPESLFIHCWICCILMISHFL